MFFAPPPLPITAVILAGGRARRMGGVDKALLPLFGRPLLAHLVERLAPQAAELLLNSPHPPDHYPGFSLPLVPDPLPDQPGPLAGLLAGMHCARHELVLAVPCDTPLLPPDLAGRLLTTLALTGAPAVSVCAGGERHSAIVLARRDLADRLAGYLDRGDRAVHGWLAEVGAAWMEHPQPDAFVNLNHPGELERLQARGRLAAPRPLLGFAAWSGTGKTTLLVQLIPALKQRGLAVAVLKHAHHDFDLDTPGKDSWRLRQAGAREVLVASRRRFALMREEGDERLEPRLAELLPRLDPGAVDLVLVEGFKHESIAKIELHRPALGKPLLSPQDPRIIAIASDAPVATPLPRLDLNDIDAIADFVARFARESSTDPEINHPSPAPCKPTTSI